MNYIYEYDHTSPESIEKYSQQLIGKSFKEILDIYDKKHSMIVAETSTYGNSNRKGGLGNLLEEVFFGYKANSSQEADFYDAGVELKVTTFEELKNGKLSAGERLVLTMINYKEPVTEDFYQSHVWDKCKLILLIYYKRDRQLADNLLYRIYFSKLFTPPAEDLYIIENDYRIIIEKMKSGLAHELSEGDTMYLGACTKGATAAKSTVRQYYPPYSLARKRAFCFKNSYMTYILNTYILTNTSTYEPIIKDSKTLIGRTFEDYITEKINLYIGKSDEELCTILEREYNNNKAQWSDLSYRMLGIKSNRAEEFQKANIVVKAIRVEEDNSIDQNMSFPPFKFMDIVEEDWEDSQLYTYFNETRFLFIVFKKNRSQRYILKGCQFWNMSQHDIEGDLKSVWMELKCTLENGVRLEKIPYNNKKGYIIKNNLPKTSDNRVVHIRPHAAVSAYKINNKVYGNLKHANELPDGNWMTTQSFWIHKKYILSQLNDYLL